MMKQIDTIYVRVKTEAQLRAALEHPLVDAVIRPYGIAIQDCDLKEYVERRHSQDTSEKAINAGSLKAETAKTEDISGKLLIENHFGKLLIEELPEVIRLKDADKNRALLHHAEGVLINSFDALGLLREAQYKGKVFAGEFLYSYNSESIAFLRSFYPEMEFIASSELSAKELQQTEKQSGTSLIWKVYGHQQLMVTAQCLYKDHAGCRMQKDPAEHRMNKDHAEFRIQKIPAENRVNKKEGGSGAENVNKNRRTSAAGNKNASDMPVLSFVNEKRESFYFAPDCALCCGRIFQGTPVYMLDKIKELPCRKILLDFTVENEEQTKKILSDLSFIEEGGIPEASAFVRGHYYKPID